MTTPPRPPITTPSTDLLRQVHPGSAFLQDGRPTSAAFKPSKKDSGLLSVSDSRLITPQAAYQSFTARGYQSAGVWAVTVGECAVLDLSCVEDPIHDEDPLHNDPAHAVIDFRTQSTSQATHTARALCAYAVARGRLFP